MWIDHTTAVQPSQNGQCGIWLRASRRVVSGGVQQIGQATDEGIPRCVGPLNAALVGHRVSRP
jgi:hypothetical protein